MNKIVLCFAVLVACAAAKPSPQFPLAVEDEYYDEFDEPALVFPRFLSFIPNIWSSLKSGLGFMDTIDDITKKGNTTSEVKVINGTIITINNTKYFDDKTGAEIHYKTIDIRPSEDTPVSGVTKPPKTSEPESTEDTNNIPDVENVDVGNENVKNNEIPTENKLDFLESSASSAEQVPQTGMKREIPEEEDDYYNYLQDDDDERKGDWEHVYFWDRRDNPTSIPVPLSPLGTQTLHNDILVNLIREQQIMEDGHMREIDPDVELFDPNVINNEISNDIPVLPHY